MGGATIIPRSLKTTRNEKNFQDRPKFFLFLKSYMTKAVNREDKRSRRYRDRDFAKFERSRRYRDR
jgi:hypothetical protein